MPESKSEDLYDLKCVDLVVETILSRHSVSPKVLVSPAPTREEVMTMIRAAATAPDHGLLRPWRFIEFPHDTRDDLADVFEAALLERFPEAGKEDRVKARDKANRAPLLLGVVVSIDEENETVTRDEQMASSGAALQNILLTVHVMGYGARAMSGRAIRTTSFRNALSLADTDEFLCFIAIGTPSKCSRDKPRPAPEDLLAPWTGLG